jgi:integrase
LATKARRTLIYRDVEAFELGLGYILDGHREGKADKPRHVYLTEEGRRFFERATAAKQGNEPIFLRADGKPWGTAHQQRPLARACAAANITPAISFHILRHTYGSQLAMRGVPLQVIAEGLGHADTRITSRHYAHLMPSYVAKTIREKLPRFGVADDNVAVMRQT